VRGVTSDGAMKTLLEKRLVTITGRSDKPGKPLLYGTTPAFLQYFGINKLADLPKIEEFEAIAKAKMEEMPDEALAAIQAQATDGTAAAADGTAEAVNAAGADMAPDAAPAGETGGPAETADGPAHPPLDEDESDMPGGDPAADILGESAADDEPDRAMGE